MYDLFVLGQLMDESMSGYLMRQILQQIVGRQRKISFGMIYPLFKRLNEAGYITLKKEKDSGHKQKIATITNSGRKHFLELMQQAVPLNPNVEFTYSVKFRNFHQVDPSVQFQILTDYQNYLLDNQRLLKQQGTDLAKTKISSEDLDNARWVISLEQVKTNAALDWVSQALKKR